MLFGFLLIGPSASALTLGTNITVYDNRGYYGTGADATTSGEDQETEPQMINNQNWDLEGFFVSGNTLQVVSGFNLKNGYRYSDDPYTAGDIFIDINGNAQYGISPAPTIPNYGYEYVLDINWYLGTYDLYTLGNGETYILSSEALNNPYSDPFQYVPKAGAGPVTQGSITYYGYGTDGNNTPLSNSDVGGLLGDEHYVAEFINLGPLGSYSEIILHMTLSCGNDNLIGKVSVPEPAPLFLFGGGLIGLAMIGRRNIFKK